MSFTVDMSGEANNYIWPMADGHTSKMCITDADGVVISAPDNNHGFDPDISKHDYGYKLINESPGIVEYERDKEAKIASIQPVPETGWLLIRERSMAEHLVDLNVLFKNLMQNMVGLAIFLVLGTWLILFLRSRSSGE